MFHKHCKHEDDAKKDWISSLFFAKNIINQIYTTTTDQR